MTNNQYLITLTPAGSYFFGNEKGFGDKTENPGAVINYLVSGQKFPQQTTLLGWLRYELLRNAHCLAPQHNTPEAKGLIGQSGGFDGTEKEYGIIESISPVFLKLQHGNETTYILPKGKIFQDGKEKRVSAEPDVATPNKAVLQDYDPKHFLTDVAECAIKGKTDKEPVFAESAQIGIKKNYQGKTEDEAFFKQTFSRLRKNHEQKRYSFAFFVSFTRELKEGELKNDMVFMGGDQSLFKLELTKLAEEPALENTYDKIEAQNKEYIANADNAELYKIVLLSDCKTGNSIFDKMVAAVTEVADFRHIVTTTDTTRFSNMSKASGDRSKSDKQELLARGSVFYVAGKNLKNFCKGFNKFPAYQTIGYNYYEISKTN